MRMFEVNSLSYKISDRLLINKVTFDLFKQELVVLIGPNGAGKSTLLRLLTGYIQPTSGKCLLQGKSIQQWQIKDLAKVRAVMRQQQQISFPYRVEEVIMMGCSHHTKTNKKKALENAVHQTECSDLLQRHFTVLSGGEQQRVQLARVLAQLWQPNHDNQPPRARCLFLDEPTSALDLFYQQQMLRLLKRLTQLHNFTVVCILHDLNLASLYADRVFLLHQGILQAQGAPQQVLTQPQLTRWYQADLEVITPSGKERPQIFLSA